MQFTYDDLFGAETAKLSRALVSFLEQNWREIEKVYTAEDLSKLFSISKDYADAIIKWWEGIGA